ncbi:hypothetical protein GJW-30_1_01500 [Variibacter gotjawalensis]|uniref:Uncharacterized protein n=1 Tax=Variibacter gotjawalensis TaxID=1333996 RepID=A0A0S3PSX3_9BRAD|nr:hypothetical protein [Variibacter gotjawalensis]NIK49286.1 hypothetical protein [Variibacter gotjawalensis]RZS51137.1 hypothetical protein EV661_3611 [Variibacter gotjawalensis]BAT58972.1 hypothetical protein GJW-30_1_01500 [Variibacter gotjawalensis]
MEPDLYAVLAGFVPDTDTGWSLGTFGAIAEFTRDPGEPVELVSRSSRLSAVTGRGGILLFPNTHLRLVASEAVTKSGWSQKVALCLPLDHSAMSRRATLTEIGIDTEALRDEDRGDILFDLGLDVGHLDACVRVSPQVAAQLRRHCGRSLFESGNTAIHDILAAKPHRVFVTRVGRIEVFQPIPPADGRSPEGPHTHLLPALLAHRRTHPATELIPEGLVPVAHFYPPHPVSMGTEFAPDRHESFQQLLRAFGDAGYVRFKDDVSARLDAASTELAPASKADRIAYRVAIKQAHAQGRIIPDSWSISAVHDGDVDPEMVEQHPH